MAGKKKGDEPVAENVAESPEATAAEVAQTQALTPEMEAAIAEAEQRGYGRAQEEIERKETVIKRLQGERKERRQQPTTQFQSTDDTRALEFMIEAEKQRENESGVPSPLRPQLETEVARRRNLATQQKMWQDWQGEIQNQEDALTKKLEDGGIDPSSPEAIPVWESFAMARQHGDFSFANKKADSLIGKPKKQTKAEKEESEEDKQKRWVEEGKRQALEGGGVLNIPAGGPSGGGGKLTIEQIKKMSPEERFARAEEIAKIPLRYKPLV